jgi:predicted metal-dependent peptidase
MALMLVRRKNPFLGTLALQIDHRIDEGVPTACTNGRRIWYNPGLVDQCSPAELGGLVLHELLHAALLHNSRRGSRDPYLWNIAADIVVNGIVRQENWAKLPLYPVIDAKIEHLRVEEIYILLARCMEKEKHLPDEWRDLSVPEGLDEGATENMDGAGIESHWKQAWRQAQVVHQMSGLPIGSNLKRLLDEVTVPQVDWRTRLWQYLVRTPNDFGGWDRRFIHRGMYLETLEGESLSVMICIDTSGSIYASLLEQFVAELKSILDSYPHVKANLYYADDKLYGPYETGRDHGIPEPKGWGGTSFVPFFDEVKKRNNRDNSVLIYLTDGYGVYPKHKPLEDTLWVVPAGGLASREFPFGEVTRIQAA